MHCVSEESRTVRLFYQRLTAHSYSQLAAQIPTSRTTYICVCQNLQFRGDRNGKFSDEFSDCLRNECKFVLLAQRDVEHTGVEVVTVINTDCRMRCSYRHNSKC